MTRTLHAGYKLDPMQVAIFRTFDSISADKTVVLSKDLGEAMREVEQLPEIPLHPRMTSQLTMPEMDIIQEYTFIDWNDIYQDTEYGHMTSSLWKWQGLVKGIDPNSTVIQVHGDGIHQDILVQFDGRQDVDEMYTMMRNIAFERGEFLAEYNQAMNRFPNTLGITEWYKAIAAADPGKESVLKEGHYIEDYVDMLKVQTDMLPEKTPPFMRVYMSIIAASNQLSNSIDETKKQLFGRVAQVAEKELQEGYKTWCARFESNTYLSRVLDKLPQDYHQAVTDAYTQRYQELFAENPTWSDAKCATATMFEVIRNFDKQVTDDYQNERVGDAGRIPTSLDVHCFEQTRFDIALDDSYMSVVSWYGGDSHLREAEEHSIDD